MNRRSAIKQLAVLGGGIMFASSCSFSQERVSVALNNLNIDAEQEKLLAQVVETIIPSTDIPKEKELNLHQFILVMVDDCRAKEDQTKFVQGLDQIEPLSEQKLDASFTNSTTTQREKMIESVLTEEGAGKFSKARYFLSITKQYAIQGFLSSEYVLTEVNPYQLVPGHFDGCVKISA